MADSEFVKADVVRLISTAMKLRNWSAARLAREAGVAPSTVTRALDPKTPFLPSARTISKLASVVVDARISVVDDLLAVDAERVKALNEQGFVPRGPDIQPGHWVDLAVRDAFRKPPFMVVDEEIPKAELVAFRVVGPATEPEFPDGCFVVADTSNLNLFADDVVIMSRRIDTVLDSKFETSLWRVLADGDRPILRPVAPEHPSSPPVPLTEGWHKKGMEVLGVVVATYLRRKRNFERPAVQAD